MVWFQCEDCGDNLKKPKLPNHFRSCSANKLSCIDCGQMFGRDTVLNHTQCISEAGPNRRESDSLRTKLKEKYGPKGQGKTLNAAAAKPVKDGKQRPVVDINVGLSERPPWFCSLCNTKATSKQALLLHAEGKKHGAKARAFHASKQPLVQTDNFAPDAKDAVETGSNDMAKDDKISEQPKLHESSEQNNLKPVNEVSSEKKKRKREALEGDVIKKNENDTSVDVENGEVFQGEKARERKIKWKKFIKAALKFHPDGLKMKKLRKVVLKALQESSIVVNENELSEAIEQKINSSSNFAVENKYVRLVAKD